MARVQRVGVGAALLAAGAVATGVALASTGDDLSHEQRSPRPTLRLLTTTPFALRGTGFAPGSTVRIALDGLGKPRSVPAIVDARGSFRISFGWVAVEPCRTGMIVVTARGADGRRAVYKRPCRKAHREPGVRSAP